MVYNSWVTAKFQLAESQWTGFNFHIITLQLTATQTWALQIQRYTKFMATVANLGARCLLDQREGKLETLTLQITQPHFPILAWK